MPNKTHMRQFAGAIVIALVTSTSASAAAPSAAAIGSAAAAKIVATAMPATATAGDTASANVHQVARKGRRGFGRRGVRSRGFRYPNRGIRRHYYGRRNIYGGRRYYGRRYRYGGPIAAGIAGIIIGGAIASSRRDYGDRWERCDNAYRTFRWSDGTYIPYVGSPRVLCPYLRR